MFDRLIYKGDPPLAQPCTFPCPSVVLRLLFPSYAAIGGSGFTSARVPNLTEDLYVNEDLDLSLIHI